MSLNRIEDQLVKTAETLRKYNFGFWAEKLDQIRGQIINSSEEEVCSSINKLYGGFGTIMDLAVDPYELPDGITEDEGNRELLGAVNALHRVARESDGGV